ncbi:MAG TPA: hypothetical protein VND54_03505 [Candidatus Saccharimonadales bacterium]|nr:hypothetical protein [Candidatus Saccharimonadales bacterium]
MARLYAQFGAVVFLAVGLGGLLTGDAGTLLHHQPEGNVGPVALHLTYVRDVLDLLIGAALAFAGFRASDRVAGEIVVTVGVVLLLLAVVGFAHPDDAAASRAVAGLHMTTPMNIFDAVAGALACLCALGDPATAAGTSASSAAEKR